LIRLAWRFAPVSSAYGLIKKVKAAPSGSCRGPSVLSLELVFDLYCVIGTMALFPSLSFDWFTRSLLLGLPQVPCLKPLSPLIFFFSVLPRFPAARALAFFFSLLSQPLSAAWRLSVRTEAIASSASRIPFHGPSQKGNLDESHVCLS